MKKLMYVMAAISMAALSSCATELDRTEAQEMTRAPQVVNITSFGTYPSALSGKIRSMSAKGGNLEEFTETKEFESSESIVLPHLQMYIFPGSLLKGNSIQDMNFKPITASVKPVTVSMSIPL
ncbi:hypothetical protein BN1195_03651 [Chryseobacterium oranimense G311]|uniref:hypothetical protein n=1 Tax=Chryseobacterium oranimense TaxID=421058 RepID=UPI000533AF02|nr:hypothetical protein [Chryseobacterium oranimense]CEJ71306.1 hypothetical protein BN1195_03651 [Chryseobacterium oranimense G311]